MKSLRHRVAVARGDARPLRGKRSTPYRLAVLGASLCGVGSGLLIKQKVTTPRKLTDLLVPTLNKSGIKSRIQGSFLKGIEKRPLGSGSSAGRIQGCCRARPSFNAPAAWDPPGPRPQPPTRLQLLWTFTWGGGGGRRRSCRLPGPGPGTAGGSHVTMSSPLTRVGLEFQR